MPDYDEIAKRADRLSDISRTAFVLTILGLTICAGAAIYMLVTCYGR